MDRQKLKHGKALCGKVFARFVETFNWLVDFCANVKGDDDVAQGGGHISVDRSNDGHPVIRCKGCGGSSGASEGESQEVVTDVSLELDTTTTPPRIVLKKTVATVKVVEEAGEATTSTAAYITLATVDAVVRSEYSTGSHAFTNKKKSLTVIAADQDESAVTPPVFTAVAHSENT